MATDTTNASDPSGYVTNPPSTFVKVIGTTREDMNGKLGIVVQFNQDRGRYLVHVTSTQNTVMMKPENLAKVNYWEQAQAQYQQISRDPQFQAYLNQITSKLPAGVSLKQAALGMAAIFVALIYFLGFSRTIMLVSFSLIVLLMIAPDLMEGGNMQTIMRNAPIRFQRLVREQFPGGRYIADNQYALVGLAAIMVVFFVKSMMPPATKAATASLSDNFQQPHRNLMMGKTPEEYYKLGFEDATANKLYGTSLPADLPSASSDANNDDPLLDDYPDYPMPPPPKTSASFMSKLLSISNIMSIMYLGRTFTELGRDVDGSWAFPRFQQNLMTLEPWRLGLLGLGVYRLVSALFLS